MVSIWDHESKKRLRQFPKYHSPVSSISFSHDGTKLAIAVCDVWDEGEEVSKQAKRPIIYIRTLGDEVKVGVRSRFLVLGSDPHIQPKSMTGK
jgi:cell cycle arrest protein BUB3